MASRGQQRTAGTVLSTNPGTQSLWTSFQSSGGDRSSQGSVCQPPGSCTDEKQKAAAAPLHPRPDGAEMKEKPEF